MSDDNAEVTATSDPVENAKNIRVSLEGMKYCFMSLRDLLKNVEIPSLPEGADVGEAIANVMLAYRHLEDSKMRLGKVIEAINGPLPQ